MALVAFGALLLWSRNAYAVDLPTALALLEEGRLGDALDAFNVAVRQQGNSQQDLTTIYRHMATLRFGQGDTDGAREALLRLLTVSPDAELADSAPPELLAMLEEVDQQWAGRSLHAEITCPSRVLPDTTVEVQVGIRDDVAGIVDGVVAKVSLQILDDERGQGPFALNFNSAMLGDGSTPLQISLVDEHGGILWTSSDIQIFVEGVSVEPTTPTAGNEGDRGDSTVGGGSTGPVDGTGVPRAPVERRSSRRRTMGIAGWTLFGIGLSAGVVGAVFVGLDGVETNEPPRLTPDGIMEEVYQTGPAGWAFIGVGATAMVVGLVLVLLRLRIEEPSTADELTMRLAWGSATRWARTR